MLLKSTAMLLLNKPSGMTSFDCVRKVKKILNRTDVGHGGTLDSFATGLLPIFLGEGLKCSRFFTGPTTDLSTNWKTYEGLISFGSTTDTLDPTGNFITTAESPIVPDFNKIRESTKKFISQPYKQMPPKFSAKKINGQRASDLVREGEEVQLNPVEVTIREFDCFEMSENEVRFVCTCSKGTYIRTLAEDLAKMLGTICYLKSLNRIKIGDFNLRNSITLSELEKCNEISGTGCYTLAETVSFIPKIEISNSECNELKFGRQLNVQARMLNSGMPSGTYCLWNEETAKPVALFEMVKDSRDSSCKMLRAFNEVE